VRISAASAAISQRRGVILKPEERAGKNTHLSEKYICFSFQRTMKRFHAAQEEGEKGSEMRGLRGRKGEGPLVRRKTKKIKTTWHERRLEPKLI